MLNFWLILIFDLYWFVRFRDISYLCPDLRIGGNVRTTPERKGERGARFCVRSGGQFFASSGLPLSSFKKWKKVFSKMLIL